MLESIVGGWAKPKEAKQYHFFGLGWYENSLCGKVNRASVDLVERDDDTDGNCLVCNLAKLKADKAEQRKAENIAKWAQQVKARI